MRLIDVAGVLSSERREETKTPHKELSGTQPRTALVLKLAWDSARRMGQYPSARRTCRRLQCAHHHPPWKRCEAPRAVCDRGAVAASGRAAAAQADEMSTSTAAPLCGRDALVQACARQAGSAEASRKGGLRTR
ncbi:hypothetical protein Q4I28_001218 [Leishmania naiffi]|uniref:Uncharacterized protein n=1 Tax=Leishmania naiffi TaxID=5678 RepID=A0AAW3C5V2_9TRYP